jgi:hypothetical protein
MVPTTRSPGMGSHIPYYKTAMRGSMGF